MVAVRKDRKKFMIMTAAVVQKPKLLLATSFTCGDKFLAACDSDTRRLQDGQLLEVLPVLKLS